ncbi:MAG TPA: DUF3237 domain-containing protein [Solimonas sp.]|nr:DUF3237 domain-containing protein [Solimonas sp.]
MDGSTQALLPYTMEYLFSITARVFEPQMIGATPEGGRAFYPVAEATLDGPRLKGKVLPGSGGDWLTMRSDGIQVIDVRATVLTDDGVLIYSSYSGFGELGDAPGRAKVMPIRATARYQTGHPKYAWLNRLHCLHIGEAEVGKLRLRYDVYALR